MSSLKHLRLLAIVEEDHKTVPSTLVKFIDGNWYSNHEATIKLNDDFSLPDEVREGIERVFTKFIDGILEFVKEEDYHE